MLAGTLNHAESKSLRLLWLSADDIVSDQHIQYALYDGLNTAITVIYSTIASLIKTINRRWRKNKECGEQEEERNEVRATNRESDMRVCLFAKPC